MANNPPRLAGIAASIHDKITRASSKDALLIASSHITRGIAIGYLTPTTADILRDHASRRYLELTGDTP